MRTRPAMGTRAMRIRLVHEDLEQSLRFARVWGHAGFDGQQVGPDHPLADRDVVGLHS